MNNHCGFYNKYIFNCKSYLQQESIRNIIRNNNYNKNDIQIKINETIAKNNKYVKEYNNFNEENSKSRKKEIIKINYLITANNFYKTDYKNDIKLLKDKIKEKKEIATNTSPIYKKFINSETNTLQKKSNIIPTNTSPIKNRDIGCNTSPKKRKSISSLFNL